MTAPFTLTWAKPGDVIEVRDVVGRSEPIMLWAPCGALALGYYCTTHHQQCANLQNLIMHADAGGAHHVATWCSKCRRFEAAEQSQADAFASVQAASW